MDTYLFVTKKIEDDSLALYEQCVQNQIWAKWGQSPFRKPETLVVQALTDRTFHLELEY